MWCPRRLSVHGDRESSRRGPTETRRPTQRGGHCPCPRYDPDPDLASFSGAVAGLSKEILATNNLSAADAKRYAVQLVGTEFAPTKAMGPLPEIGKTLVGRPQLYSTIAVDGGLAAYIIKAILLGQPVKSGRYFIKFTDLFQLTSVDFEDSEERRHILDALMGGKS